MKITKKDTVFSCRLEEFSNSIPLLLERCDLGKTVSSQPKRIMLKPNLVEIASPPITTPVKCIEAMVDYLLEYVPANQIIIAEGCAATEYSTHHAFHELGYTRLSDQKKIELLDLNEEPLTQKSNPDFKRWPEIFLPTILDEVFLISIPQLKAHSLSAVTLSMKNMMGCAPPRHYQSGNSWKKSAFHNRIHMAVFDLNQYRTPDFSVLEASIGMAQAHLWGPHCDPPVGRIAASADPVAMDSYGSKLLGRNWKDVDHIAMANGVLGNAESYTLIEF